MIEMKDQWFVVYRRLRIEVVYNRVQAIRVFEPIPNEPMHVIHSDGYHPFGKVRNAFHLRQYETGELIAACGKKFTSRDVIITASKPDQHCKACIAAQLISDKEHEIEKRKVLKLREEQFLFDKQKTESLK